MANDKVPKNAYKNVLIAVDLSAESSQVLDAARLVTDSNAAFLHLLTVIKPLTQVYGGLDMAPIATGNLSFEEEAAGQARQQLLELATRYGVPAENAYVALGSPSQEIREVALEHNADLIVIGTHGRHGLGLLLGATANAVLHGVECDVLAVRIKYT